MTEPAKIGLPKKERPKKPHVHKWERTEFDMWRRCKCGIERRICDGARRI